MKLIKKADIILIAVVLLLVFLWLFLMPRSESTEAVINSNGEIIKRVDLTCAEGEEIIIGNMHIYADKSGIAVISSDCPDKLCERAGKINKEGQVIACVPNKVVIAIEGARVDGVTG